MIYNIFIYYISIAKAEFNKNLVNFMKIMLIFVNFNINFVKKC